VSKKSGYPKKRILFAGIRKLFKQLKQINECGKQFNLQQFFLTIGVVKVGALIQAQGYQILSFLLISMMAVPFD